MATPSYRDRVQRPSSAAPPTPGEDNLPFINPRRKYKRRGTGSVSESKSERSDDGAGSSMSESEEHELSALDSDPEWDGDEETGRSKHERKEYLKRKRRRHGLDSRIAGTAGIPKNDVEEADQSVLHRLLVNAGLIGLWYFFSLAISIPPTTRGESHPQKPLLTPLFYFTRLVPTGTATSLDIGLGNTSLRYITLTFYTMCKSSVLIFVLTFAFLFRLERLSMKLVLIITAMTIGVLMMVAGETAFHALGFTLAMSASFFSGFRWALTQILLLRHPATSNPFATLFFLSPIMFVSLTIIACLSETPAAVITGIHMLVSTQGLMKAMLLLFVPGLLAFCMIASEFTLLQRTSVVTLSICGIFKEVITISAAGIVFHDELSMVNISGLIVTICSIASYNYLKIKKMREEARTKLRKRYEDQEDEAPFDDEDASIDRIDNTEATDADSVPLMHSQEGRQGESVGASGSR
ncbi:hypothetical protein LTR47_007599 [Exophiala xenobiotica]|nr:hypothetical protein LTR47_007599 [Exophiala xenobiotica]KAK5243150.1 hypothetical protein LTS06_011021 [Exophiala xenobiotica]KAK5346086.1 hypothetical protein LTR61_010123 [Exophiala xenobiotica]KAK5359710.1 hypothetical protein LTR11_010439 [Exophiala xenobiotica]KAK5365392.1 hypothetical protein LTS03_008957 [Exophiala xenobiotica]